MKLSIRNIFLGVAVATAISTAFALDLPVKRVNGHDYYYYEVKRGETLLQIAERLGVSRENIIRYNPAASDCLRPGSNLYLPVDKFRDSNESNPGLDDSGKGLRYKVQRGESLYGISYHFRISPESIIALNPKAEYGVKAGDILILPLQGQSVAAVEAPVEKQTAVEAPAPVAVPEPLPEPVPMPAKTETEAAPLVAAVPEIEAEEPAPALDDDALYNRKLRPVVAPTAYIPPTTDTAVVALLAPLDINEGSRDRHARNALDFVRGFLMGLDSETAGAYPLDVQILDTKGSNAGIAKLLSRPGVAGTNVVIAPDEPAGLSTVLADVKGKDCYVMNLFSAQDTSYLVNPQSIQTYIPTSLMYEKAAEALNNIYGSYTPVFLIAKGGKSEKLPFTNYLRDIYAASGVNALEIMYEGMLTAEELEPLDRDGKYVFIPASGAHSEFTKFARALLNLRMEFGDPAGVALFGYPDWTAFIDESADMLHNLGATVYSRFFNDAASVATREFVEEFEQLYGVKPVEQVPSQAMLGYDSARYIIANLKDNNNVYTPEDNKPYVGLQSTFMFRPTDEEDMSDDVRSTGPVNQALYIVTYGTGDSVKFEVL